MGMINDLFKKMGFKKETKLLEEGKNEEKASITRADELAAEAKEKFNSSLKATPTTEVKIEEDAPESEQESKKDKKPVLKVFAEQDEGYTVKLVDDKGKMIPICIIKEKHEHINLREIVERTSRLIVSTQNVSDENNVKKQQEYIKDEMDFLHRRYRLDFTEEMDKMVNDMNLANKEIDYQKLINSLPKSVDVSKLSHEQIMQYGKMLSQRLNVLDSIGTPEDAYSQKDSLERFMKSQEKETARGAIVTANLENIENGEQALDVQTIVALAKKMETISNEDGLLYATYLKLEENRIIRRLQKDIVTYRTELQNIPENVTACQMSDDLAQYLDSIITNASDGEREDIITYMIDTLQGRGIENYAKNCLQHDTRLKVFLKHTPIKNQELALEYASTRIACFGQVVGIASPEQDMEKIKNLRSFIETTDYKDEDNTETKKFLYTIAQIERDYIRSNYSPILHEFKKFIDNER